MKSIKLGLVLLAAVIVALGAVGAAVHAEGGSVATGGAIVLGLLILGASVAGGLAISRVTVRDRNASLTELRQLFSLVAERAGLRLLEPAAYEHPIVGTLESAASLVGVFRNYHVDVKGSWNDEDFEGIELVVMPADRSGWPEWRRLDRGKPPPWLSLPGEAILGRLRSRQGCRVTRLALSRDAYQATEIRRQTLALGWRIQDALSSLGAQPPGAALRCLVAGAGAMDLEAILYDLVALADALPRGPG
jgi:hypothetical protein